MNRISLLDYGAGNVRSLRNAIKSLGYEVRDIESPKDIESAEAIIFPGVGSFGQAMQSIKSKGFFEPLKAYISAGKPFFGICIGMQCLFEGSDESPEDVGLGIIPGRVTKFSSKSVRVPQIGWNEIRPVQDSLLYESIVDGDTVYFVHSYCAIPIDSNYDWALSITDYGDHRYMSSIQKGNVLATQFHPEKSGKVGLNILKSFLSRAGIVHSKSHRLSCLMDIESIAKTSLVKRVIACLDVRNNDAGDLIVTKGDQYDVREENSSAQGRGLVRNLGKPVALCKRYFDDGADEIVFLNITSFRQGVLDDLPMLQILEQSSENVFVPLTVGGGIREYTDPNGKEWSSLEVASRYFRAGADKVSIGSDAVYAVEKFLSAGIKTGQSSIEQISKHYGAQAVVVSVDPKRVYVHSPHESSDKTIVPLRDNEFGPEGQRYCWWQVTVKGGRETRDLCAVKFAKACEDLGAGEVMLNCIDMDGQCKGYDIPLISAVQAAVSLPVIASSGAGAVNHFSEVFKATDVSAALAAGMFHRNEVSIAEVKDHLFSEGIPRRR